MIEMHKQDNIMAGSKLTLVQWAFPNPFPRAGDIHHDWTSTGASTGKYALFVSITAFEYDMAGY